MDLVLRPRFDALFSAARSARIGPYLPASSRWTLRSVSLVSSAKVSSSRSGRAFDQQPADASDDDGLLQGCRAMAVSERPYRHPLAAGGATPLGIDPPQSLRPRCDEADAR